MKKVKSLIKKPDIKSFVLGIAIAIFISFGVTGVMAIGNQSGGNVQGGNSTKQTYKFIGQEGGLVDRIGSLTIGGYKDASWIMDPANKCLTIGDGIELQSCLSVIGNASFSKLTVLDMPAFIQGASLFLNADGDQSFLSGLPSGLVIDDFSGTDDSIMSSSLQYEINGVLAPRNLDERRNLCADSITGRLIPCGEFVYHWETGTWGDCLVGGSGTCSGSWTTTGAGSCTGNYQTEYCDGNLGVTDPYDGRCDGDPTACDGMSESTCNQYNNWGCAGGCDWYTNKLECSTLGATTSSACIASPHNTCIWDSGANSTNYCSDKDGTSASECTGYNSVCAWADGTSSKTRTVVCKDSSGQTVADSLCTGDKPVIEETCDSGNNNTTYSCIGTTPSNSRFCSGDDLDLTQDTSKTVVDSCGTLKCEYTCNSGYIKSGNSCVQQVKIDWTGSPLGWVEGDYYGNVTSPSCGYKYMVDFSISGIYWLRRLTIDYRGSCIFRTTSTWEVTTNSIYQ